MCAAAAFNEDGLFEERAADTSLPGEQLWRNVCEAADKEGAPEEHRRTLGDDDPYFRVSGCSSCLAAAPAVKRQQCTLWCPVVPDRASSEREHPEASSNQQSKLSFEPADAMSARCASVADPQADQARKFLQALIRASAWWKVDELPQHARGVIRRHSLQRPGVILCLEWELLARRTDRRPERTSLAAKGYWRHVRLRLLSGAPLDIEPLQQFVERRVVRWLHDSCVHWLPDWACIHGAAAMLRWRAGCCSVLSPQSLQTFAACSPTRGRTRATRWRRSWRPASRLRRTATPWRTTCRR